MRRGPRAWFGTEAQGNGEETEKMQGNEKKGDDKGEERASAQQEQGPQDEEELEEEGIDTVEATPAEGERRKGAEKETCTVQVKAGNPGIRFRQAAA